MNATHKLIKSHLISGDVHPGAEIGLKIDQVLQQDATGTLVMLELEAIGLGKVKADVAVQYVDHNLLQTDYKNADDHLFLQSAAKKFGYWYSRAGNGISHVVHMERFGVPGKSLLGSDSHTCAGGGLGMLAIGTGGLDVALAAAGEPYYVQMPRVMGIKLTGKLPDWVSAKDVVLEMLRRHDVNGGRGYVLEYYGEGVKNLSTWDRHVIANMGVELGATATVFPSDERTRFFLRSEGREDAWQELKADDDTEYDWYEEIDLSALEPLIALPSSPGKVVPVREVADRPVSQVVVGSSANPGLRDFWIVSEIIKRLQLSPDLSLDINPTSRQVIQNLADMGSLADLIGAGARFHQTGCMGCIGMGQAPASGKISLRTMPRNFPGRSGTRDDQVYLCSPETAAAAALTGRITDPRDLEGLYDLKYPQYVEPEQVIINEQMLIRPGDGHEHVELVKGPNIKLIPDFERLPDGFRSPAILKMGDNISTDEILRAGTQVLPLRSNIPEISKYAFEVVDELFNEKAARAKQDFGGHVVIAGDNYAQGSSREHAALAPRYLGQQAVIAKSYARIGWQNLINFGIIPFTFENPDVYHQVNEQDVLQVENLRESILNGLSVLVKNVTSGGAFRVKCEVSERQKGILLQGGVINYLKSNLVHN